MKKITEKRTLRLTNINKEKEVLSVQELTVVKGGGGCTILSVDPPALPC